MDLGDVKLSKIGRSLVSTESSKCMASEGNSAGAGQWGAWLMGTVSVLQEERSSGRRRRRRHSGVNGLDTAELCAQKWFRWRTSRDRRVFHDN